MNQDNQTQCASPTAPNVFRCICGWVGNADDVGDYVLRNRLGCACPQCSSVAYMIDPIAETIHRVEALAHRLYHTPMKDIGHDDIREAIGALRTINVLNARIAELEIEGVEMAKKKELLEKYRHFAKQHWESDLHHIDIGIIPFTTIRHFLPAEEIAEIRRELAEEAENG